MDTLALLLSIIGSLNWGLVGIFKFDLVAWIFGGQAAVVSRIIYTIIGLAGLWCITMLFIETEVKSTATKKPRQVFTCRGYISKYYAATRTMHK